MAKPPLSSTTHATGILKRNRRSFNRGTPFDHGPPIWRPNIAAVTSILSATLILFMIHQIPPTYHAVTIHIPNPRCDSAEDFWGRPQPDLSDVQGHVLGITEEGAIMLEGHPVSIKHLREHLETGLMSEQEPPILFSPHANAPYAMVLKVLGTVKKSGTTLFFFDPENLAAHQNFSKEWRNVPMWPSLVDPPETTAIPARTGLSICL